MSYIADTLGNLLHQTAFFNLTWGNYVMILVACVFLYLAIAKEFEPLLLVPISLCFPLRILPTELAVFSTISTNWMSGQFFRP